VKKAVHFKSFAKTARQNAPHVHVCARLEAPNSKLQRSSKIQIAKSTSSNLPSGSPTAQLRRSGLIFGWLLGAWDFSGAWCLVLEIYPQPQIDQFAGKTRFSKTENPSRLTPGGAGAGFRFTLSSVVLRFCSQKPAQRLCHAQGVVVMTR
jgi:hypothetical protein